MPIVYASPTGTGDGSTKATAMSLEAATGKWSGKVQPGTTVVLLTGVYRGTYNVDVSGTPSAPINYRAAIGGHPILDGNGVTEDSVLRIFGSDTRWTGIEITNSDPNRTNPNPGSTPVGRRAAGVGVWGPRTRLAYCNIHDNGNGVGMWTPAVDSSIDACVIQNNGWVGPDRRHGHGLYIQNETGAKTVTRTLVDRSYEIGVHLYGVAGIVKNVTIDRVIVSNSGGDGVNRAANLIAEANNAIDALMVKQSIFYQPDGTVGGGVRFGTGATNGTLGFLGNLVACGAQGLSVNNFDATVAGNTIAGTRSNNPNANAVVADWQNPRGVWNANTYYTPLPGPFTYNRMTGADGGGLLPWDDWRRLSGADATGTLTNGALPPQTRVVPFVTRKGGFVVAFNTATTITPAMFDLTACTIRDMTTGTVTRTTTPVSFASVPFGCWLVTS